MIAKNSFEEMRARVRPGMLSLLEQTQKFSFETVLDVGAGDGFASHFFAAQGKKVTLTGYAMDSYLSVPLPVSANVVSDVDICAMRQFDDAMFDAVWCSHVLEHVQNPGLALSEMRRILKPGGFLFLVVPEYAPVLVGGHVTTGWTVGTLMYNLVLAGFDVRFGEFINHCWNVAGFVRRAEVPKVNLRYDKGDLESLAEYFPVEAGVAQGMYSELLNVNWIWNERVGIRAQREFGRFWIRKKLNDFIPPVLVRGARKVKRAISG